jgi:precorrin-6A/cobalt-precorrin-6A reductase
MLWLIGGTQESVKIAEAIASLQIPCTVTVTTEAAQRLYSPLSGLQVLAGKLDEAKMAAFIQQQRIVAVVDASHPFAVEVSRGAIAAAAAYHIPYLRYERPGVGDGETGGRGDEGELSTQFSVSPIPNPNSFDALLAGDYLENQRVFLTVGYKALPLFKPWQTRSILFARILPAVNSLEVALSAGFTPDRLIALRPPISPQLEEALWRQWHISLVVTKASGKAGGEDTKRAIAAKLGIPLIIMARPAIAYPQQTSDLNTVITFCRQFL